MHNPLHNADGLAMDVFQVCVVIMMKIVFIMMKVMMKNIIKILNMMLMTIQEHEGTHILQSLDGFAISLASDGR